MTIASESSCALAKSFRALPPDWNKLLTLKCIIMNEFQSFKTELGASLKALEVLGKENFKERIELWVETKNEEVWVTISKGQKYFDMNVFLGKNLTLGFDMNDATKEQIIQFCSRKVFDKLERLSIRVISE